MTVALVAGATRGAGRGIAIALGEAGATVYCTGRSTARAALGVRPARDDRGDRRARRRGRRHRHRRRGRPPRARRRSRRSSRASTPSRAGSTCSSTTSGAASGCSSGTRRCGSTTSPTGLRLLRLAVDTHLITSHFALPLLIRRPGGLVVEMTDGTRDYNDANYRINVFYDLAKTSVAPARLRAGEELAPHGCTAVALTPGWLRSEMMLEAFGVTEDDVARGRRSAALRGDLREPALRRPRRRRAGRRPGRGAPRTAARSRRGELAQEYGFTDVDGSRPDCWRYMVEVQDPGLPADATGYR